MDNHRTQPKFPCSAVVELEGQIEQHLLETELHEEKLFEFAEDIEQVRVSIRFGRTTPARPAVHRDIESLVRVWAYNSPQSELRRAAVRRLATIAVNSPDAVEKAQEELRQQTPDPSLPTSSLFDCIVVAAWFEKILDLPDLLGTPTSCLHARLRRHHALRSFAAGHSRELRLVLHFARVVRYASTWLSLDGAAGESSEPELTPLTAILDLPIELDDQQIERILKLERDRYRVANALGGETEPEMTALAAILDRAIRRDQQQAEGTFACESLRHGSDEMP